MNTIKFFKNGLKVNKGKLQKCFYSIGNYTEESGIPQDTIKIYANHLFGKEVKEFFRIENKSDVDSGYFESDEIKVYANHPLYSEIKKQLVIF